MSIELTVAEFNQIMTDVFEYQLNLKNLCISGEISQFNYYSQKQHLYLTMKHEKSSLQCVIYNQHLKDIPLIKQGDKCKIIGQCRYLKNKGQLIFSGVKLYKSGTGKSLKEFEKLKMQMKTDGLFDIKQKSDIPQKIDHVAIITAANSAAFHDIQSILLNNDHTFSASVIPATMQGLLAPSSIIEAIEIAEKLNPNIICIARGGGAEEDFACYNERELCQIITNCKTPILTGIGHQINETLTCLCANENFETPTALAQFICLRSMEELNETNDFIVNFKNEILNNLMGLSSKIDELETKTIEVMSENKASLELKVINLIEQLELLNPLHILKKGYIYCESNEKNSIKSIQQIKKDDIIKLHFWNGIAKAKITNVNSKSNKRITN